EEELRPEGGAVEGDGGLHVADGEVDVDLVDRAVVGHRRGSSEAPPRSPPVTGNTSSARGHGPHGQLDAAVAAAAVGVAVAGDRVELGVAGREEALAGDAALFGE